MTNPTATRSGWDSLRRSATYWKNRTTITMGATSRTISARPTTCSSQSGVEPWSDPVVGVPPPPPKV